MRAIPFVVLRRPPARGKTTGNRCSPHLRGIATRRYHHIQPTSIARLPSHGHRRRDRSWNWSLRGCHLVRFDPLNHPLITETLVSPLEPGADFSYELTGKRGAALVTRHQTYKQDALRRDAFEEYTKKHYDSWVAFSRDNQYGSDAKPVLVSGVDMTKDFAMAAYSHEGTSLAAERTISIPTIGSAPASLWGTWRTRGPTHTNHGPQQCVPPSSAQVTQTSSEPTSAGSVSDDYNQCVFVRYYTMRERMGFYSRMPRAAAGSHDPGPGSNRDDTFPESTSVNEGWGSAAVDTGSDQDIVVYNTPQVRYPSPPLVSALILVLQDEEYDEFDIIADYVFQVVSHRLESDQVTQAIG